MALFLSMGEESHHSGMEVSFMTSFRYLDCDERHIQSSERHCDSDGMIRWQVIRFRSGLIRCLS